MPLCTFDRHKEMGGCWVAILAGGLCSLEIAARLVGYIERN